MFGSTNWVHAFCSVVFDVTIGQKVEHVIPHRALSLKEQTDIAFHSFPDSVSQELRVCSSVRDSCFFFRARRKRILYCFVFCRQRYDERLERGAEHRAIVVVSLYPFSCVLRDLCKQLGTAYFNDGHDGMEQIYEEVLSWPQPQFHQWIKLQVAGQEIRSNLPPFSLFPPPMPKCEVKIRRTMSAFRQGLSRASTSFDLIDPTTSLFHEIDVYQPFQSVLNRLWTLWEMALTNQPLVIVAPTPLECSNAVAALISLISPIPFAADFRPYFTIHDPAFEALTQQHDSRSGWQQESIEWDQNLPSLIGITNLYFIKVLPLWPNVLSIGERVPVQSPSVTSQSKTAFRRFRPKNAFQSFKSRAQGAQVLLSSHVENLWSQKKGMVKPDLDLCKELSGRAMHGINLEKNSEDLKQHFSDLTSAFLDPFKGYFVPVKASVDGTSVLSLEASGLPEFDPNEFLSCICDWPFPQVIRKHFSSLQDLQSLYESFLASQNFKLWFHRQQKTIAEDLGLAQSESSGGASSQMSNEKNIPESPQVVHSRRSIVLSGSEERWDCSTEVRLVEEFWRLHSELMDEMQDISTDEFGESMHANALSQTEKEFIMVFSAMPDDLRRALLSSPAQINFVKRLQQIPDIKHFLQDLPSFIY